MPMKKIICVFVLFALSTGVHADNKKKKQSGSGDAPAVKATGGGGGGGRSAGLPGMSHGLGQTSAPRSSTRSAPSMGAHVPSAGHASNSLSPKTGPAGGTAHSSNPLLRKSGQAGATQHSSNPLAPGNRQGATGKANPLTKQS